MILVIDDHPVTREPLAKLLRYEGFQTACAANGMDALTMLQTLKPSLILLDVMMPKMNGIDFLEVLRHSDSSDVPVIALTGIMDPNQITRLKELNVVDVMTKAKFTVDELLDRVRLQLASSTSAVPDTAAIFI